MDAAADLVAIVADVPVAAVVPPPTIVHHHGAVIQRGFLEHGLEHETAVYSGQLELLRSVRAVSIKCRPLTLRGSDNLSPDLLAVVDANPSFLREHFCFLHDTHVWFVQDRALYSLADDPFPTYIFERLAVHVIVRQCIQALLLLHRLGYSYGTLKLGKFVVVEVALQLEVRLTDFHRSRRLEEFCEPAPVTASEGRDLARLLQSFVAAHQVSVPEHRRQLLDHLLGHLSRTADHGNRLVRIISHPAVQHECLLHQLVCAVSDKFEEEAKSQDVFTPRPFVGHFYDAGRRRYLTWPADLVGIGDSFIAPRASDYTQNTVNNIHVWGPLDEKFELPWAIRVFRNKSSHFGELSPATRRSIGEPPTFYTRKWMKALPRMFIDCWRVILRNGYSSRFPCYFHLPFPPVEQ